jgi:tRNA1(Val) A37 N6-methylase TrmN6
VDREVKIAGPAGDELTDDAFLGGALQILQPRFGYRAGIDAVLLAAAVTPTRGPLEVIDIGAGVGTAGLCLARRIPYARVVLLEREPELVQIATENVRRNGLSDRVRVVQGEVGMPSANLTALGLSDGAFALAITNPPFHRQEAGTAAPDPLKAGSHAMPESDLERWGRFMARMVRPGGTVTIVHKADALARLLAALDSRFGGLNVLPLQPRADAFANRIIVSGIQGSRAPLRLFAPFVMHESDGAFTSNADAILRAGAALSIEPAA